MSGSMYLGSAIMIGIIGMLVLFIMGKFYDKVDTLDLSRDEDRYKLEKYRTLADIFFSGIIATAVLFQIMIKLTGG